jgi:hypothetical protein
MSPVYLVKHVPGLYRDAAPAAAGAAFLFRLFLSRDSRLTHHGCLPYSLELTDFTKTAGT